MVSIIPIEIHARPIVQMLYQQLEHGPISALEPTTPVVARYVF